MSAINAANSQASLDHISSGRSSAAVRGAAWSVVSSFAPAAFGILVFMATSRMLVPAEFGLVAYAASIATLGTAIAPAGFGEALVQRRGIEQRHLDAVFWLCIISGIVIFAGLALAAGPIAVRLGEPQLAALIPFIGARVIFDMGATVPNALLVRAMAFKQVAMRTALASLVAAGLCLALLWLGFGLWALAFSQLATSVVACAGAMFSARWWPRWRLNFGPLKDLGAFGLFASGNRLITMLSVDQILIGTLLGPAGLGIYGFARRIFQILSDLITGALSSVSYALLSSMQGEHGKLREAYLFATFASSVASFPVFVGLALIADDFVPLAFGQNWVEAVPAVQAFCALGLLTSIGVLQASLVKSQGQADLWFYYLVAKQVGTLLYVGLFYSWGVNALTLAIVIQNYVMWLPAVHMVVRILRISPWAYLGSLGMPALATLLMAGAGMAVKLELAQAQPLLRLGVTIGVCAVVYAILLLLFARRRLLQVKSAVLSRAKR
ncbi:lipopolysaccharide biosynthesis protein [uncultured Devosia sp.]|uniref:lipopolysaccharide biosynthesis protein n=1 Tax=uncultured Devosia sp. TaxID=211434 RepID=UPI0035CC29DC